MKFLLFASCLVALGALCRAQPYQCPPDCPRDCKDLLDMGYVISQIYIIFIAPSNDAINVYCDMTTSGGGWTLLNRRISGVVNFTRPFNDYKIGFGEQSGNFFQGLDDFHRFSQQKLYTLRIDMRRCSGGATEYAEYSMFRVYSVDDHYAMGYNSYIGGSAGDSLAANQAMRFTANDVDNDLSINNCAASTQHNGAWWHNACTLANLNGVHNIDCASTAISNIYWHTLSGYSPLSFVEMKIRPQ